LNEKSAILDVTEIEIDCILLLRLKYIRKKKSNKVDVSR